MTKTMRVIVTDDDGTVVFNEPVEVVGVGGSTPEVAARRAILDAAMDIRAGIL